MRHALARFVFLALSPLAAAASLADDSQPPATGDVLVLPGPLLPLVAADTTDTQAGTPGSPAGWHLPGRTFTAGANWFALVCAQTCALHATRLDVTPATHGVYDGDPVESQLLHWSPLPDGLDRVSTGETSQPALIALLRPGTKLALVEGPVRTWLHRGMPQYPDGGRTGTMETRIPVEGDEKVLVIPRVTAPPADLGDGENPVMQIELRIGERHQRLGEYTFNIEGAVPLHGPDYLAWAGDLDGDGKPDLIIRLGNDRNTAVLYLSTFAKPGELVGEAGRFDYFDPSSAGC